MNSSGGFHAASDSPLLALGGEERARFTVTQPRPRPIEFVAGLLAGVAEVDLTPPPGMPKAGYSSNARTGRGFRTRLRARVIHLRSGTASLALVQCDLLGGSSVVARLVARAVADSTDVGAHGLFMGATHTHAGPGQFLGSDFYNRFASNRSGFDPAYTQFLVERIAGAVHEAVAGRGPARLAVGKAEVWGLTRNRSLSPHVANSSVLDKRTAPQRKFVSINPFLHLVRVDAVTAGKAEPLGAMVIFSVHGTGVPQNSPVYNADVWAYLVGELAHRIATEEGYRPVVGAVQGTHGDVAPAIHPGAAGALESERVGRAIGAEAADLYRSLGSKLSDAVILKAGMRDVNLDHSRSIDGIELPRRPAVGAALVAGATENYTPVIHRVPPFRPGSPRRRASGPHGPKWVLGSRWLQPLILPTSGFPRVLPIQFLQIGHMGLVGLPFEVTVQAGRAIAGGVDRAVAGGGISEVVISSVANEYSGYVTTPEEYALQFYEGGHTLYGARTAAFLGAHAAQLAGRVSRGGEVNELVPERSFDLRVHRYLPAADGKTPPRTAQGPAQFNDPDATADGFWEFRYIDASPGDLNWHEPMARVETEESAHQWRATLRQGRVVDDQGWDMELVHLGALAERCQGIAPGGHEYALRWWNPSFAGGRRHRFVLVPNAGRPGLESEPFD